MDALRNIGNPNWIQRTGFKFNDSSNDPKKRVNIEIRNNRAYIDNGHLCEKGELLLSATGTIGDTFICPEKCYITPSLKIVKFKYDLIENDFFKFWVLQHKNQMLSDVESVYVPNLNKKTFNEYLFPIPPKKEQSQISEKLKTYFSLLDKL
jgi:restriction endonuclease S subunit